MRDGRGALPNARGPRPKLSVRGERRRREIKDTALALFAGLGYERTTVAEICDEIGVGKGVFYWYFDSKHDLFVELLEDLLDGFVRAEHSGRDRGRGPVASIEAAIRALVRFLLGEPALPPIRSVASRNQEFACIVRRAEQVLATDLAAAITDGVRGGAMRMVDCELTARAIVASIFCFVEAAWERETAGNATRVEEEVVAFCLSGLLSSGPGHLGSVRSGPDWAVGTVAAVVADRRGRAAALPGGRHATS